MDPDLAAALQKNERLTKEVLLLRDAIDRSNEALEEAVKTKEERDRLLLEFKCARERERTQTDRAIRALEEVDRLKKLAAVVLKVWNCTCNHNRNDRSFTCNCCRIRYELEDLGLVEKPVGVCDHCDMGPDGKHKPDCCREFDAKKEWAICGWCAGGADDPDGSCPKCHGAKGKWIEKI